MTAEDAANLLHARLHLYRWYLSIGAGTDQKGHSVIYVYVKSTHHKELRSLAEGWMGYAVNVRSVGSIRPAALGREAAYTYKLAESV
jgi:hypothetical protein